MAIEILREILSEADFDINSDWELMNPEALRFTLEYLDEFVPVEFGAEREKLAALLKSEHFLLTPLYPEQLGEFAVLAFPGVDRVLPQSMLFQIGYELADALGLGSCEPDLGTEFYSDPVPVPAQAAEAARAVGGLCLSQATPPGDHRWALANAKIDKAWSFSKGEGIIVAQPDTGVASHVVLPPAHLRLDLAINILTNRPDPADPLSPGMANPGHGTATGSVAAGIESGAMSGAAPKAQLVPIRCINDVKIFNAAPVAKAIAYATSINADVISMSLGGIPSRAVHKAIRRAVDAGTIIVTAAGNCVRVVVWPARYDETIAAGGTNVHNKPWKGTSLGGTVDICAPAEHVWVARRSTRDDTDTAMLDAGQGTSFATALIAGAAALWLAHHGRDTIRAEAQARGIPVQELFRAALKKTARVPDNWDKDDWGAGILDAEALLQLQLADIPGRSQPESTWHIDTSGAVSFLAEELETAALLDPRYLPELAAIGLRQRTQGQRLSDVSVESKRPGTFASPTLMEAIRESADPSLAGLLVAENGETGLAIPEFPAPYETPAPSVALLTKGSGLEAAGESLTPDQARDYLAGGGKVEQTKRIETMLANAAQSDPGLLEAVRELTASALDALAGDKAMDTRAQVGLEALVLLNGRPALLLADNRIDFQSPLIDDWHDKLFMPFSTSDLPNKIAAVGRIDAGGIHWGTGFVVGPGLIATNRHVIQQIAAPIPRKNRPVRWMLTLPETWIDFACEPTSMTVESKFRITGVIDAGELEIDPYLLDFTKVDAALLAVEPTNEAGKALPDPIALVRSLTASDPEKGDIYTVGYPARPSALPTLPDNSVDMEVIRRLQEIFGAKYGRKYFSPGRVMRHEGRVFYHDPTTLGGCSGSPVLRSDTSFDAIGLHFGGAYRRENYAENFSKLHGHPLFAPARGVVWRD